MKKLLIIIFFMCLIISNSTTINAAFSSATITFTFDEAQGSIKITDGSMNPPILTTSPQTYTLGYVDGDDNDLYDLSYTEGNDYVEFSDYYDVQVVTAIPNNGYRFKEWQLNGVALTDNERVSGNITLTAIFEEVETYSISGVITSITDEPMEDIKVTIDSLDKEATTNASGEFTLEGIEPGTYDLSIHAYVVFDSISQVEVTDQDVDLSQIRVSECSHHNLSHTPLLVPTTSDPGCREYYYCSDCQTYFEDSACDDIIYNFNKWQSEEGDGYITSLAPENEVYDIDGPVWQTINIKTTGDVLFTSDASFESFICVLVDGELLDPNNYIAEDGSTDITLKSTYLKTLANGEHVLVIISADGHAINSFLTTGRTSSNSQHSESVDNHHYILNTSVE